VVQDMEGRQGGGQIVTEGSHDGWPRPAPDPWPEYAVVADRGARLQPPPHDAGPSSLGRARARAKYNRTDVDRVSMRTSPQGCGRACGR
jgi:hypothetical protein